MPKMRYLRAPGSEIYHIRGGLWFRKEAVCGQKFRFAAPYEFEKKFGKLRLCRKCRRIK